MVPRRAHLAERIGGLAGDDGVDRGQAGTNGAQASLPGARGDDGVAIDVARVLERPLGDGAHFFEVRRRVRETDLLLDVLAQRRFLAHEIFEDVVRQNLVDGAHAVGPLRVSGAGVVLEKRRVCEKKRRHGCACRVLIVGRVQTAC